jgi:hypothetical protein
MADYSLCKECDKSCTMWSDRGNDHDRDAPYWSTTGTWTWDGSSMWVGSNGSSAVCLLPQNYNKIGQTAFCNVTPNAGNGQVRTTYLMADYKDSNNFHALKVVWTGTGSLGGTYSATIVKRTAGTDSVLSTFTGSWTVYLTIPSCQLCVIDSAVMGVVRSIDTRVSGYVRTSLHGGRLSGMLAGSDDAQFGHYYHKRHFGVSSLDGLCPTCTQASMCGGVCTGGLPLKVKTVISGLYNRDCLYCSDLNGIYIASLLFTTAYQCCWEVAIPGLCETGIEGYRRLRVNAAYYGSLFTYDVWVDMSYSSESLNPDTSWLRRSWYGKCYEWSNFEVPLSDFGSVMCNRDGSSAYLTAI